MQLKHSNSKVDCQWLGPLNSLAWWEVPLGYIVLCLFLAEIKPNKIDWRIYLHGKHIAPTRVKFASCRFASLLPSRSYITQHINIDEGLCSPNNWRRPSGSEKKWIQPEDKRKERRKKKQTEKQPPSK